MSVSILPPCVAAHAGHVNVNFKAQIISVNMGDVSYYCLLPTVSGYLYTTLAATTKPPLLFPDHIN